MSNDATHDTTDENSTDAFDFDEDEVARVRIEGNDDPRRDFTIQETTLATSEILYLRLPLEDIRSLRDWANEELGEWEDYDASLLRSTAAHRGQLEDAAESAVNDMRRIADRLEEAEDFQAVADIAQELDVVAGHLENVVETAGDDDE